MRTTLLLATIVALCFPGAAWAEALSNDMTCAEAVAHYEKHRRMDTNHDGQILPIFGGVPVSERAGMWCDEDEAPTETFVKTRDREQCPISYSCTGEWTRPAIGQIIGHSFAGDRSGQITPSAIRPNNHIVMVLRSEVGVVATTKMTGRTT